MITLKSKREIEIMRGASRIVAEVLNGLRDICRLGITTGELDEFAGKIPTKYGATAAFKGYRGFPASIELWMYFLPPKQHTMRIPKKMTELFLTIE